MLFLKIIVRLIILGCIDLAVWSLSCKWIYLQINPTNTNYKKKVYFNNKNKSSL